MPKTRLLLSALAGVVYFSSAAAVDAKGGDGPQGDAVPIDGIWTEHRYGFTHLGFTSTYSCDGLADKLKSLLRASGARADISANPGACSGGLGRPSTLARVDLKFFTLKPAAEVEPAAGGTVPPALVPGVWKPVQLQKRAPRDLGDGDCELIEEFRDFVLPMFAIRAVNDNLRCIPHQVSGADLRFEFESFVPVQAPGAAASGQAQ